MKLLVKEYKILEEIQEKIFNDEASPQEINEFLDLIVKSGNEFEMLNYMKTLNLNTIVEVKAELNKNKDNSNITSGLAIAGGAILLAFLLSR